MTAEETRALLERFYGALARADGETMASMYAEDATFEDEVFRLRGADIGKMWIGLTRRAKDFSVAYTVARADRDRGIVEWTARYLFGGKRPVVNVILSELELEGGKIRRQLDRFDFSRWAAQAIGPWAGPLARFGWFRRNVAKKIARRLGVPPRT
ncbi:MAG TPA: nuclear transport factor 2 family protein [Thermoanaerobaculia bacterium]|nr:nuclear transport factor 2 family protein [Thermoanaerobaculia bacterium]